MEEDLYICDECRAEFNCDEIGDKILCPECGGIISERIAAEKEAELIEAEEVEPIETEKAAELIEAEEVEPIETEKAAELIEAEEIEPIETEKEAELIEAEENMMNNQTAEDMQNNAPQESPEEADKQMLSAKFRVAGCVVLFIAAVFIINAMETGSYRTPWPVAIITTLAGLGLFGYSWYLQSRQQ